MHTIAFIDDKDVSFSGSVVHAIEEIEATSYLHKCTDDALRKHPDVSRSDLITKLQAHYCVGEASNFDLLWKLAEKDEKEDDVPTPPIPEEDNQPQDQPFELHYKEDDASFPPTASVYEEFQDHDDKEDDASFPPAASVYEESRDHDDKKQNKKTRGQEVRSLCSRISATDVLDGNEGKPIRDRREPPTLVYSNYINLEQSNITTCEINFVL